MVMFKEDSPSPSRRASGGSLSLVVGDADADWRKVPLLFARRDARWLARAAVRAALARFVGRGLALSMRVRHAGVSGRSGTGSGGGTGDEVAGAVAIIAAAPVVGGARGEHLSPFSLLLSSLRLTLLARSRLLLPEWCVWARAAVSPAAVRNQRHTSSVVPSVSNTNLAGIPSSLQRTHALYCE